MDKRLLGTWKLVSFHSEFRDTGAREEALGPSPTGYLIFGADERMMALIVAKERKAGSNDAFQAGLFRSMMSYTGRYRVEGNEFVTAVDASWNEEWTGTEQRRFFKIEADRLEIISAWLASPRLPGRPIVRGILSWVRCAASYPA